MADFLVGIRKFLHGVMECSDEVHGPVDAIAFVMLSLKLLNWLD
jgi:hypothetical protein